MIRGIGTDIADIRRFTPANQRLAECICTESELSEYQQSAYKHIYLAKKWASKEAISKALGTGIRGITTWKNMEIQHDIMGKPIVIFYNELKIQTDQDNIICHISISDNGDYVVAYTVLDTI
jgi:holo-[acyl-carrier protein] synthase